MCRTLSLSICIAVRPRATETDSEVVRDDVHTACLTIGRLARRSSDSTHVPLAELCVLMQMHSIDFDYCTVHSSPLGPLGSTG
jgi:hypothetical protein